jgi:HK97 family phage major capsid protein
VDVKPSAARTDDLETELASLEAIASMTGGSSVPPTRVAHARSLLEQRKDGAVGEAVDDEERMTAAEWEQLQQRNAHGPHVDERGRSRNLPNITRAQSLAEVDEYRGAWEHYVRTGSDHRLDALGAERRALAEGSGSSGGYLVPPLFLNKIVERLQLIASVRSVAQVIQTDSGQTLSFPTTDLTGQEGEIVGENVAVTELDSTYATANLPTFVYDSKLTRVPLPLLQDSAIDLESFLPAKLADRIARIQNRHFTLGTGTGQPQGFVTGGTVRETAATGNTVTVPYDSLVNLVHSIDPAYRADPQSCVWIMADATFAAVRKLKDLQNRPLVEPDLQSGLPASLFGYRIVVNNYMATPAANAKSIAFGNFQAGYLVRDVRDSVNVMRLSERYAEFLQVGFLLWLRSGGLVQDTNAYSLFQHSAT